MKSLSKKLGIAVAVVFALSAVGVSTGTAQEIKGPIKIIVPYPAGGGSDVSARLIADKLKGLLNETVIVENKAGAGGKIGTEYAKGQPADGSSMLFVNPALFVVSPMVYSKLAYDPDKDFKPLTLISTYEFVLAVPAGSPIKDVKSLVEWMKKNPKEANFGSPAAGSLPHFFGLMISKYSGVEMVHVPYAGSAPLLTALIGGQIPMAVDVFDQYIPHHPEKVRILATAGTSRKRPDIPTFKDMGYEEIVGVGWNGIVVPAGTPKPVIEKLNKAVVKAVQMPDVKEKIEKMGSDVTGTTAEEFAQILKENREKWGPVITASGFKAD